MKKGGKTEPLETEMIVEDVLDYHQISMELAPSEEELAQEAVVEAVLFAMGRSVEVSQLAAALGVDRDQAKEAALRLMGRYEKERRGLQVIELEDAFQMCTRSEYYENLIRVASTPKRQVLTEVVLETLSIIAYRQPVTKLEIEKIRGVKSDHAVNKLIEYDLVYEVGRLDAPGRPALFATTEEFLRRFGIGSMTELPGLKPEQEEEIRSQVEEELQMKLEELGAGQEPEGPKPKENGPEGQEPEEKGPEGQEPKEKGPEGQEPKEKGPGGQEPEGPEPKEKGPEEKSPGAESAGSRPAETGEHSRYREAGGYFNETDRTVL